MCARIVLLIIVHDVHVHVHVHVLQYVLSEYMSVPVGAYYGTRKTFYK